MTFIHRLAQPVALCFLVACASAAPPLTYIAPTPETVFARAEETSASPGQIIYIENHSTVPITVYSVTVRDCENIKLQCSSPRRLNLRLAPNDRETLLRIEPTNPRVSFRFHYSFGWRADSSTTAALAALASAGDTVARQRLAAIEREDARRRSAVGAQGETLGRLRALQWRLTSGVVSPIKPDTLVAIASGRAVLQLKLPDNVLPGQPALHTAVQVPIIVRE